MAAERCVCKRVRKDGERWITFTLTVDWGADDLRAAWNGDYALCSFKCLAQWASEKAAVHDGRTLVEGTDEVSTIPIKET